MATQATKELPENLRTDAMMKPFSGQNGFKLSQIIMGIAMILLILACKLPVIQSNSMKILLPLYIYPNWYEPESYIWSEVVDAAKQVPIVAIINPHNGPDGKPPNQDYARGLKNLNQADIKTLGYVYSRTEFLFPLGEET